LLWTAIFAENTEKYKSFYSPSGTDPREYHIYIDCIQTWLNELKQ